MNSPKTSPGYLLKMAYCNQYLNGMEFVGSGLSDLGTTERNPGSRGGRMWGRRRHQEDDSSFKSKNLHAERRRRQKLGDRLLILRSLVPIITNMTKETIIEDSITYIKELQTKVNILQEQLFEMEASAQEALEPRKDEVDAAEEMKKFGIQIGVDVAQIHGNKLWVKAIFEKKRGGFSKLVETMTYFGFELTDTNVTTSNGAMVVSSIITGFHCDTLQAEETRELMLEIVNGI
ncbi:transcription factor DYT1-like [Argentina anserina]|uniref:transcription factor DYT1-like n=1 Tax=Argentina anserina TaxID=57926 RepID=UPI0021762574|nr:transcription factor DYT1-like [Potentilla anserina]